MGGNVRELESVIERAIITSRGTTLQLADDREATVAAAGSAPSNGTATLADAKRQHIVATLDRTGWRLSGPGGAELLISTRAHSAAAC